MIATPSLRFTAVALVCLIASGCGKDAAGPGVGNDANAAADTLPPVFQNLGAVFGAYDASTGLAGDFQFRPELQLRKVFEEFGDLYPMQDGSSKVVPHFTYYLRTGSPALAAFDGVVDRVEFQADGNDYELFVATQKSSRWRVSYDHVVELRVRAGDRFRAGDTLALAAPWAGNVHRYELTVSDGQGNAHCPLLFLDASLRSEGEASITRMMRDWEMVREDATLYDEAAMVAPGCRTAKHPLR